MSQHLSLTISNEMFDTLKQAAEAAGSTPEQVAADWLVEQGRCVAEDPLLRLAGCIKHGPDDIAAEHDKYIGEGLLAEDARRRGEDPLLKLLGSIDSDISDVAENHDKHIGEG